MFTEKETAVRLINPPQIANYCSGILKCQFAFLVDLLHSSADPQSVPPAHRRVIAVETVAEKIKWPRIGTEYVPIPLHAQLQFDQVCIDCLSDFMQLFLVWPENNHIIHVSDHVFRAQLLADMVVQPLNIEVREDRTRIIA